MCKFKKHHSVVDEHFKDLKEKYIINEIINQSIFQKTYKPLIEQTYLANICGCSRMTINRILKKLNQSEWITHKMVANSKGYTTTQISITDKLKGIMKDIGREKKTTKKMKEKVINSVIPNMEGGLSLNNVNF